MIRIPDAAEYRATMPLRNTSATTLWGLDAVALHDRYWASLGLRVIRRGSSLPTAQPGHSRYLLLEPDDMVLMSPEVAVGALRKGGAVAVRVRVVCREEAAFGELIVADQTGEFKRIQRHYRPRTRCTSWSVVTDHPHIAALWSRAASRMDALRTIRCAMGSKRVTAVTQRGELYTATIDEQRAAFLARLLSRWSAVPRTVEGVAEIRPGVFAHSSARIAPDACIIGPLWIGAGVSIDPGEVMVGPRIKHDAHDAEFKHSSPNDTTVDIQPFKSPPRHRVADAAKRAFDIGFSLIALTLTAPLFPLIIGVIVIEDGWPAWFVHKRQSIGGREFGCLKFRTMFKDAEARKKELQDYNHADGPQFFIPNDPRLLPVGRILRKCQLDELPQFINVLKGDMSIVGPRPSPDAENQCCPLWREARLSVKPGITGLWQVRRTREPQCDFQEWIRYDLEYVQKRSLLFDIRIIVQTVTMITRGVFARTRSRAERNSQ